MASRPRLTPHQRDRLDDLRHVVEQTGVDWIPLKPLGAERTYRRIANKGYALIVEDAPGPRGGERFLIRLIGDDPDG